MRLREFFRGPSASNDRKSTNVLQDIPDIRTCFAAIQTKDNDLLQNYLLAGFPVDQADPTNQSRALHVAVESSNSSAIELLLKNGAQTDVLDCTQSTPLHLAASLGSESIVHMLLSHGADVNIRDISGRTPFHIAVCTGNLDLVEQFLSMCKTNENLVQIADSHQWTALMCACASNQPSICARLVSANADLSAINDQGMTVIHLAAFLGSLPVLKELLSQSSSSSDRDRKRILNQGDRRNQTPLFYACVEGHVNIIVKLLEEGADPYHLDNDRQTCLHAMLTSSILLKRHLQVFYLLIQRVDFRSFRDNLGRTLVDLALINQSRTICLLLKLLGYPTTIEFDQMNSSVSRTPLSLKQIVILKFKTSIIYHRDRCQPKQSLLLKSALQQTFRFERSSNSACDDALAAQPVSGKFQKNSNLARAIEKRLRKTVAIVPFPVAPSKNPLAELARKFSDNQVELVKLLDFPSLKTNPMLVKDLEYSMEQHRLNISDSTALHRTDLN